MIVTRSSGPTSLRMKAAAPALIASNSESSSSLTASTMIPVDGSSRLMREVVSMPPGDGSDRSMRMMSGEVSMARSVALRLSSASATITKSPSRSRILRIPTRNRAWSSTSRMRVFSPGSRRSGPPRRRSGPVYSTSVILSPLGWGSPARRPFPRRDAIEPRIALRSTLPVRA